MIVMNGWSTGLLVDSTYATLAYGQYPLGQLVWFVVKLYRAPVGRSGNKPMYCGCLVGLLASHCESGRAIRLAKPLVSMASFVGQEMPSVLAPPTRGLWAR